MRNLTSVALLFLLCAPLLAQQIDEITHAAAYVEFPPATLAELARTPAAAPLGPHEQRSRQRLAPRQAHADAIIADFVTAPAAVAAPPVTRGFRSSFDPLPGATFHLVPADASGAAGPHHVVGVFNNSLAVHDREGNQLAFLPIEQFWQGVLAGDTAIYDPRILYDAVNDRWVVAMLAENTGRLGALLLATTTSGDPTGTWRRFRVAAGSSTDYTLDFTRMALTSDQIIVTANLFTPPGPLGVDIFSFPKSAVFSADPAAFEFTRALAGNAIDFTPVTAPDTTVRLLLQGDGGSIVQYNFDSTKLTYINEYRPPAGFRLGDGECSQLGTTTSIECDGSSPHYALVRNGVLWVVHSANDGFSGFVVVWKITPPAAKGFVLADIHRDFGYPSIAVNRLGAALVGFSMFSDTIYPSAGYCYIDPNGNVSEPGIVKSGENWYSADRWGDYSSTVVDPADDTSFWTLQSYAAPPSGTSHATWGTWWSYVQIHGPRVRAVKH
jgi:hypothetical protein